MGAVKFEMLRLVLVVFACLAAGGHSLDCSPCEVGACPPPACCPSGSYILGECGCCEVCAKAKGETCGGPWDIFGSCAAGLRCLRQCEDNEDKSYYCILINETGVCLKEKKAKRLLRRARAQSRRARLDKVGNSLRPAPRCAQSGGLSALV